MCGIAGYYSREGSEAVLQVRQALYSQQHRGQESCGIASSNGQNLRVQKAMGYVKEAFHGTV